MMFAQYAKHVPFKKIILDNHFEYTTILIDQLLGKKLFKNLFY